MPVRRGTGRRRPATSTMATSAAAAMVGWALPWATAPSRARSGLAILAGVNPCRHLGGMLQSSRGISDQAEAAITDSEDLSIVLPHPLWTPPRQDASDDRGECPDANRCDRAGGPLVAAGATDRRFENRRGAAGASR